jgi:hypothetical protein
MSMTSRKRLKNWNWTMKVKTKIENKESEGDWRDEVFEPIHWPKTSEDFQKSIRIRDTVIWCLVGALFVLLASFIWACAIAP